MKTLLVSRFYLSVNQQYKLKVSLGTNIFYVGKQTRKLTLID